MHHDAVIIGSGPSGIALGIMLQLKGRSVVIVDKCIFPRDKLCGGLLTPKSQKFLESIIGGTDVFFNDIRGKRIDRINVVTNNNTVQYKKRGNPFIIVNRKTFDNALVCYYKKIGGIIHEGCRVNKIDYAENKLELSDGSILSYRFLIGADGVYSSVRKYVDPHYKPDGLCFENYVNNEALALDKDTVYLFYNSYKETLINCLCGRIAALRGARNLNISLYMPRFLRSVRLSLHPAQTITQGFPKYRYGWAFPRENDFAVGFGGTINQSFPDIKKLILQFNSINDFLGIESKNKSMYLPFGEYVRRPIKGNVLLIGDAAGLADPISGEGIYFAFLSAKFAYRHVMAKNPGRAFICRMKNIHFRITVLCFLRRFFYCITSLRNIYFSIIWKKI